MRAADVEWGEDGSLEKWRVPDENDDSFNMKYFINQEDCIRCNKCLEVCPVDCISVQKVSLATIKCQDVKIGGTAGKSELTTI